MDRELRFEKISREIAHTDAGRRLPKIVFGLESFNQRVMDFMKKGSSRILFGALWMTASIWASRCTVICHCGLPTEKRKRWKR